MPSSLTVSLLHKLWCSSQAVLNVHRPQLKSRVGTRTVGCEATQL